MNKIIFAICVFASSLFFSQNKNSSKNYMNVNSLSFTLDSSKELATINWQDIKEAFKHNSPESNIFLEIKLNTKEKLKTKLKVKYGFSYKVEGKAREIDSLVLRMRKVIKVINKVTKKLKNED
ncbi:hypothetical protein BTO04_12410 [Polaribacter sp. SA4-10]|uniref:hypothetical protein n=1 Tax=Polaribacter sp. SA4-10 TaxID=754397 RepID=UPI000B3CE1D1|nr:hypothetical protein [Polaribacter sp. SA4-10]ARV07442.1 hypothetical protein BTO04_12410 [Polaribacter sp. SA4-10]